ncbi:membrane cofactor protein-like isoform X2 [Balearica regulorum gibbericeps]|uniref:membrane cofactor protein-like isoform X2 n=1 Tax=Balearica regulorum gibbericeps TaxID=100784 RepID=UPI003F5F745E
MPGFLPWPGQLLAVAVLVLQPAGSLGVQCPVPSITHGQLKSAQNFTYGSTATLECDAGYVPVGAATTVRCLGSGRWHPRVPACTLGRCPYPPAIDHTDRSPQHEFPVGTTVTYVCRSGYALLPDVSPITTCLKNFTWSSVPKLCQKMQCPSPTIPHGRETSPRKAEYSFGHQVEFQCDPGYVLRGSQRIQCWSDGTWRPPVPYCDKVCAPPPKITNGQHSGLRTEQFSYGLEIKYSCAEGLSLIGDESIYCTSDDGVNLAWSGPAPQCKVVRCPKPTVERGRMTPQRFTFPYGAAVRFSCDEGFVLHGDAESRCLADGAWHPALPTCQPDDGSMSPEDSRTATCLPDGKWTPLPECKKEDAANVCEEVHYIQAAFECDVPMAEVKTLLEIQKLFLEIKKLKVELENLNVQVL